MEFLPIFNQMVSLFLIGLIGFVMYKASILDDTSTVRFTKLILNITLPAQIVTSFMKNRGSVAYGTVFFVFGISVLCYLLSFLCGLLFVTLSKVPITQKGTYLFMHLFANVGFMGFPVIDTIFGEEGMIYAVIFNVVFNVLVYSVGIMLIGGKKSGRFEPRILLNTPFIAAMISIALFFTTIELPGPCMAALDYLGNVTTPVAMLILGSTIASMPIRALFDDWRIYLFTGVRLGMVPLAVMFLLKVLGISNPVMTGVMIILSAMPVATNTTMLALEYGGDLHLASKGIFFTTLGAVITIPAVAMFC